MKTGNIIIESVWMQYDQVTEMHPCTSIKVQTSDIAAERECNNKLQKLGE